MDLKHVKNVGIGAAYKAAQVIRSFYGNLTHINKKGAIDLVTEADLGSEKIIIETLRSAFPDHGILAEESGLDRQTTDCLWVIDPLDGTTNFAHQVGLFAVSIAFALKGEIVAGIVLNPITGELFTATAEEDATLNGAPIRVSDAPQVSESLLVSGFPYDLHAHLPRLMERFERCLKHAQGVRRFGSASIDLCYVACGRVDGYWEQNLHPWDTAAGMLIAQKAGGKVTDFSNRPFDIYQKEILATNGSIHEEMLRLLELRNIS